ncbi:hypothetical protein [Arsukibacterium sp.]|uniref:hypothetical protein n=1 Tax=Arsukibacterium sp. TaxID=1977258 RepID=UPI002FD8FDAF
MKQLGILLSRPQRQGWFCLQQLLDSVLADVVTADAQFQLTQVAAWRDFSGQLQQLEQLTDVDAIDLAISLGRLEHLGITELSITVPLQQYQPAWWQRCWWWFKQLFGARVPTTSERYRLADSNSSAVMAMSVTARRSEQGRWVVDNQTKTR